jgi:hypothetical protein
MLMLIAARNTAPPDQVLVAGWSRMEATRVARGRPVKAHFGGRMVRNDRAPAHTATPPCTSSTLPSGLAQIWWGVPSRRKHPEPPRKKIRARHHQPL